MREDGGDSRLVGDVFAGVGGIGWRGWIMCVLLGWVGFQIHGRIGWRGWSVCCWEAGMLLGHAMLL